MKRRLDNDGDCLTLLCHNETDPVNPVRLECDEVLDASDLSVDSDELVGSFVAEWKARKFGRFERPDASSSSFSSSSAPAHEIEVTASLLLHQPVNLVDTEELIDRLLPPPREETPSPPPKNSFSSSSSSSRVVVLDSNRKILSVWADDGQTAKTYESISRLLQQEQDKLDEARRLAEADERARPETRLFEFGDADFLELAVLETCGNVFARFLVYGDKALLPNSPGVNDAGISAEQITIHADLLADIKCVNNTLLANITFYLRFNRYLRDIYARSDPLPSRLVFEPTSDAEGKLRDRIDSFCISDVLTQLDRTMLDTMDERLHQVVITHHETFYRDFLKKKSAATSQAPNSNKKQVDPQLLKTQLEKNATEFVAARYRPKVKTCGDMMSILELHEADCFFNPMVNSKYAGLPKHKEALKLREALLSELEETRRAYMRGKANELRDSAEQCLPTCHVLKYVFEHAKEVPRTFNDLVAAVVNLFGVTLGVYSQQVLSRFKIYRAQQRSVQLLYSSNCHPEAVAHVTESERVKAWSRTIDNNNSSDEAVDEPTGVGEGGLDTLYD